MDSNAIKKPRVSVIIPTRNSQRKLHDCLKSVFMQSFTDFEVIVVDNYSKDDTIKIASSFPVKIVFENKGTRGAACNIGIFSSSGDIVAFTDADCLVPNDWLEKIVDHFGNSDVYVVGGPDLTPKKSKMWEKAFGAFCRHITTLCYRWGPVEQIIGCNSAYRKEAVIKVGGFREDLITAEETELHRRIKKSRGKLVYDPGLTVNHFRRTNLVTFFRQQFRYGFGKASMLYSDPSAIKISNVAAVAPVFVLLALIPLFLSSLETGQTLLLILSAIFLLTVIFLACYGALKEGNMALTLLIAIAIIIFVYAECLGHILGLLYRIKKASRQYLRRHA